LSHGKDKQRMAQTIEELSWLITSVINSVEQTAFVITDKDGRVLQWNNYYQELMGYPDEVLASRSQSDYYAYLENKLSDPAAFYKCVEEANSASEKTVHYFSLKDGRTIKKTVYPLFRNALPAGHITHLTDEMNLK